MENLPVTGVAAYSASGCRERLATIGGRNQLLNSQTICAVRGQPFSAGYRRLPPRNSLIMQAEILAYQISSTWSRGTRLRFADAGGKSSCAAVSPTYDRSGERLLLSNYLMERSQSHAGSHVRYG